MLITKAASTSWWTLFLLVAVFFEVLRLFQYVVVDLPADFRRHLGIAMFLGQDQDDVGLYERPDLVEFLRACGEKL